MRGVCSHSVRRQQVGARVGKSARTAAAKVKPAAKEPKVKPAAKEPEPVVADESSDPDEEE